MTPEDIRALIAPYLNGELNPAERAEFEARLAASPELRAELEELRTVWQGLGLIDPEQPSAAMRARFYQKLNALNREARTERPTLFGWWNARPSLQVATGLALLLIGIGTGLTINRQRTSAEEVTQLRGEVHDLRQMIALSLMERQSASARLEGVSWGRKLERPDQEVSSALLAALNHDANVNVRLSAVDALQKFSSDPSIRQALVDSIPMQESPLVQIALIDALVQIHDSSAGIELQKIAADRQFHQNVRQRARWGIQQLGIQ
jgi:hypothetical protein